MRDSYIVVQGNPIEGYRFIGPMPNKGARLLAEHLMPQEDTYVAHLEEPQAIPAPQDDDGEYPF
ncbi:MAG: hypothetical protein Unbinned1524contig1001_25 [Prokaryotic dsDNA virus sp.]|nr:MAG: hypothetical protein Unbinned1524contig1001_25 [Prokaryotic dsDNA virus sp.]|tara:strand:+ start:53343 stop:53534 length:192 start_codon:yes stop_codon:yes gene_type:complete